MASIDHLSGDERTLLLGFLDLYREAVLRKIEGLSEEQARWRPTEQANSMLNLVYHLAGVERWWFQGAIAGQEVERDRDSEFRELPTALTVPNAASLYRREWERGNEIARAVPSLDEPCKHEMVKDRSVRWVLLHMLEETARHAGHADLTRELIDGAVGF